MERSKNVSLINSYLWDRLKFINISLDFLDFVKFKSVESFPLSFHRIEVKVVLIRMGPEEPDDRLGPHDQPVRTWGTHNYELLAITMLNQKINIVNQIVRQRYCFAVF